MRLVDDQDTVAGRFLAVFRGRGYAQTPSAPLTACDPTVTFVNATVTPFKSRLVAGEPVGRTCQRQECVRATGETPWLFSFSMVGALADGGELTGVCRDTTEAILAAAPWLRPADVYALLDARDADLCRSMQLAAQRTGVKTHPTYHPRVGTRWRYGDGIPLAGRGLTYVCRYPRPSCGPACAPDCGCGTWQGFGNIIVIEGPQATYVESGVGVESMRATAYGGQLYRLPEVERACAQLEADGYPPAVAAEIVNLRRVTGILVAHGVEAGSRGGGYVLRRFAIRLLAAVRRGGGIRGDGVIRSGRGIRGDGVIRSGRGDGDWREEVRSVCGTGALADLVIAEGERRERSRAARESAAASYVRRRRRAGPVSREDLCQTFGLDRAEADSILLRLP